MPEQVISAPPIPDPAVATADRAGRPRPRPPGGAVLWLGVAAAVIGAAAAFVVATGMRPGYDAFGWLVWGRQVLHWKLNTDGAPSWKPMAFLFTLPYALAGSAQLWLWLTTAVAGALGGAVFAARIAFKLTGPSPGRRYAPWAGAAFAAAGVLGISIYWHQTLIANSDPLIVALCLAAIDSHLSQRPRLTFALLVLASLGRPEVWPFAGLYAVWLWRAVPGARVWALAGVALVPALWFSIPALTSKSWFISGDLALGSHHGLHGSLIPGVIRRWRGLLPLSMQLTALFAIGLGLARRDRATLGIAAAACLWVIVEIVFAYHGWSAVARYLIEPAAVMAALAGSAVGRVLAYSPRRPRGLRWVGPAAVVALLAVLAPSARQREQSAGAEIAKAARNGRQLDGLRAVVAKEGGAARIRGCGQPVTLVGFQSAVAWETGFNVGEIGYRPGRSIDRGLPIVVLKPHDGGWLVRAFHPRAQGAADCERLRLEDTSG